tara:strand:+ start:115 stop:678 length:564 start_codon:yes stop_codon:yes gene_type:complete
MKRIDERRFDFVPKYLWTTMSKNDKDNLRNYRLYFRHLNDNDKKIEELEKELKDRKEKKKSYVTKLTRLNKDLDHLRNDYNYSFSITKLKSKDYYNGTISRRGHNSKSFTLGSPKLIEDRIRQYFKRRKDKIEYLDKVGWKQFLRVEFNENSSKVKRYILGCINKDVTLRKFSFNRKILFPLKSDNK